MRRDAYHENEKDGAALVGRSRTSVRVMTHALWHAAIPQIREVWAFLRMVRSHLYVPSAKRGAVSLRVRIPVPAGLMVAGSHIGSNKPAVDVSIGKGLGMLRTFNTNWHNMVPELSRIMASDVSLDDKLEALRQVPFLQEKTEKHLADV